MMTDDQILLVVSAHKEGKKIQYRNARLDHTDNEWFDVLEHIGFDFRNLDYRVAPEPRKPREWWIHPKTYPDVEFEKDRILTEQPQNPAWIHVVEVLE